MPDAGCATSWPCVPLPPQTLKLEMTEHAIIAMGAEMVAAIHDLGTMGVAS